MISSKILVQSATAGLMAGTILAIPLFVLDTDEATPRGGCPYAATKQITSQPSPHRISAAPRDGRHVLLAAGPIARIELRPAPKADILQRSLDQRNAAARQALEELNNAYEHSDAQQRGAHMAHTVATQSMARQAATRINIQATTKR